MAKLNNKIGKAFQGRSGGFTLIEVLVALALFGLIAVTFAGGLATASRAVLIADIRTNAESLARTEMEYVKSQTYSNPPWGYQVTHSGSTCTPGECPDEWFDALHSLSEEHALYIVQVDAVAVDASDDHEGREVITLVGYKIFR
jgi:prepilin-type N-terminal cleavage/methylation domain-containing protein